MTRGKSVATMAVALTCLLTGAGCQGLSMFQWPTRNPAPIVFQQPPTTDDIVRAINSNTAPIRQLDTDSATVTASGFPPLRANLALERPKRLRLRANLIGPEVDLGSNDDLFWVWFKHNPQPALYYAKHEQYALSPARRLLPIEPSWLVEALGVVQLDPLAPYEGPVAAGPNRLELRTRVPSADGEMTRIYVIDSRYGFVLEQRVLDPRGQLLASAVASQHRYYAESGVSLPQHVELKLPPADLALSFHVRDYRINSLGGVTDQIWTMPQLDGIPLIDVAGPVAPGPGLAPRTSPTSGPPLYPSAGPTTPPMPGPAPGNGHSAALYPAQPEAEVSSMNSGPRYRGYTERR